MALVLKPPQRNILTGGLIGYWPLQGDVLDYSGRGFHGTLNNSPAFVSSALNGTQGQCLRLNVASTQYVSIPSGLFSSNVYTVSLWATLYTLSTYRTLFSCRTGDTDEVEIIYDPGYGGIRGGNWTNSAVTPLSTWVPAANQRYHICVTSDGTTLTIYTDGYPSSGGFANVTGLTSFSTFTPVTYIGQRPSLSHDGDVNDVRVYNRALSPSEINTLYNIGVANPAEGEMPSLSSPSIAPTTYIAFSVIQ